MTALRIRRFLAGVIPALTFLLLPTHARGQSEPITWDAPQVIDTGVTSLSESEGVAVQWGYDSDIWVFYEKDGNIYTARRTMLGWGTPRRLTIHPARQTNPHVAGTHVVWEDYRGAVPEIWTAEFDGTNWSLESMLSTDDGIASRHPVISAGSQGYMAAWEDSSASGFRVFVRRHDADSWLNIEPITISAVGQRDPSVSASPYYLIVGWADFRHGDAEIYTRTYDFFGGSWSMEARRTNLPGACRHPALAVERYGDLYDTQLLAFECAEAGGVIETYAGGLSSQTRISPNDGTSSVRPNCGSFAYETWPCGTMPGADAVQVVAWTDLQAGGSRQHHVWSRRAIDSVPVTGIGTALIAATEGQPTATICEVWLEDRNNVPTLVSRTGSTSGCWRVEIDAPPALLIGPEGIPENLVRTTNVCSGNIAPDVYLQMGMDGALIDALRWDPAYPPQGFGDLYTDDAGEARFSLHGGGCSATGTAWLECFYHEYHEYVGAKSPDINGDCVVRPDDLAYVQARLGSTDFCCDLDMSGTVGPEDVAIVESTMWDHCTSVSDVVDGDLVGGPALEAAPNPATRLARIHLTRSGREPVGLAIVDAAGRRIRTLEFEAGESVVTWDLRSQLGARVPAGLYVAVTELDGRKLSRPILVCR
jgi:hypothetical protein